MAERDFLQQYRRLSNPNSAYYRRAYGDLQSQLGSASPTMSSLLGIQMAMGGSYKGSLQAAQRQRRGIETRIQGAAQQGVNQLYQSSQGLANQALQGAEQARQFDESQPGAFDYLAGPLSTVAGSLTGGLLGSLGGSDSGGSIGGSLGGGSFGSAPSNNMAFGLSGGLGRSYVNPSNISQQGLGRTYNDPFNISQGGLR